MAHTSDARRETVQFWGRQAHARPIPTEYLDRLVMEYLVVHGCGQSAVLFSKESNRELPSVDPNDLHMRSRIRRAVSEGRIQRALTHLKKHASWVGGSCGFDPHCFEPFIFFPWLPLSSSLSDFR